MTKRLPCLHPASAAQRSDNEHVSARDSPDEFQAFLEISTALTGFSVAELLATDLSRIYFEELGLTLGLQLRSRFLSALPNATKLMTSKSYGPLARNVIRLWYLGRWAELPQGWIATLTTSETTSFDKFSRNVDRFVSSRSYVEGLAWKAIGTHPPGAKQPGFASWAEKP